MIRQTDQGIVLVNVLVVLALGAGLVALMLSNQERDLRRTRLAANSAQAQALALGAETSVIVALRRDLAEAPESDHLNEAWATALQESTMLETGQFSIEAADANARFDINRLAERRVSDIQIFSRLAETAGVAESLPQILGVLVAGGPVAGLDGLTTRGVDDAVIEALRPYAVALPVEGVVNLNTAGPEVLAAVLDNPGTAARLLRLRERTGELTPSDLADAGVIRPPATGFTSDAWDVSITAESDGAVTRLQSRILRNRLSGRQDVFVHTRRYLGDAAVPVALPDRLD